MLSKILMQPRLEGIRTDKKEILDQEIAVIDFKNMDSKFSGQFVIIQAKLKGETITITGNSFMLKQLFQVNKDKFPIFVRINKKEKYYRLIRSG